MRIECMFALACRLQRLASAGLAVFCLTLALFAATVSPSLAEGVTGRRTALVIGNSEYRSFPGLPNAVNDATRVKDVLEDAGFEVGRTSVSGH